MATSISRAIEQHDPIPGSHIGGRKGTSSEHIYALLEAILSAWEDNEVAGLLLLSNPLQLTNHHTAPTRPFARLQGEYWNPTRLTTSPILDLFYNAELLVWCANSNNTNAIGYIDDVAIIARGRTEEECWKNLEART